MILFTGKVSPNDTVIRVVQAKFHLLKPMSLAGVIDKTGICGKISCSFQRVRWYDEENG
jgi:hypothetical protein